MLRERLAASRATWPALALTDDDFLPYLAARIEAPGGAVDALRTLCVTDLWLACAVGRGEDPALRAFEVILKDVGAAIAHLDGGSALVEDVGLAVRERVLGTDAGGKAKIAEYRGRGDLRGWLRVVAVREALQLMRRRKREAPIADDLASRLDDGGAATAAMSPDEIRIYREAFAAALATLSPRERNLLRQQYLHGSTVDELGALYGVHRATAARWVAAVRETLLRRTRRAIGEAMQLTGSELDSAMARVVDHLDLSLRQTLSLER